MLIISKMSNTGTQMQFGNTASSLHYFLYTLVLVVTNSMFSLTASRYRVSLGNMVCVFVGTTLTGEQLHMPSPP